MLCSLCGQLVSVYVNNWCGADGEQADASSGDYNTLPHYQRYQRCLQHQQQACLGHYHTGQRAQLMYETVGRSRDGVEGARAMLCSRHGRSNSLSPGRARYAAGQLPSTTRIRRPLMPPADSTAPTGGADDAAGTSADDDQTASASPTQRGEAEQSASSAVDEASTDAARDDLGAADNAEVSAEADNTNSRPRDVPVSDNADGDATHPEPPADTEQPSDAVANSHDLPTDAEECTETSTNDDEVFEARTETDENVKVEDCSDVGTLNEDVATSTKDDHIVANDVVNGDPFAGEISSKDWPAASVDGDWSTQSPVIRFDQTDTALAKFDSSALEKILSSLSATSLRSDHDGLKTGDDNDDDDVDEVWMRHDVVDDACQSSLSMLDAAAAQLDNGQHFKSRRRRSSSSSSSSSSVGHCSPSCLIPPSTVDTDTDTSSSLFFSGVTKGAITSKIKHAIKLLHNCCSPH